ncbi:hypothetical protein CDAR_215161 [Caerostris darwini]|uniref:NADH dehydrogenase subunit 5 n=1 Tax=Caerostris darwini TaxID=1538125 RepID=A0AAV4RZY2_9ARAC|nr:hypothetical protein CDAR_215161 [Caerostris darwini]
MATLISTSALVFTIPIYPAMADILSSYSIIYTTTIPKYTTMVNRIPAHYATAITILANSTMASSFPTYFTLTVIFTTYSTMAPTNGNIRHCSSYNWNVFYKGQCDSG